MTRDASGRVLLGRHSLRATDGRVRILEILKAAEQPVSAAEVHERLGENRPDLVTVYRNLERFTAISISRSVQLGDGVRRYELADRGHHHHLVCTTCGTVEDLPSCDVAPLERLAFHKHGFRVASHLLEFFGTCQTCMPRKA